MKNFSAKSLKKSQLGQGMTEYIIIVAMVAIAAIAVYQLFGKTVQHQTAAMANELAGGDGGADQAAAMSKAQLASGAASEKMGLDNYTGQAARAEQ